MNVQANTVLSPKGCPDCGPIGFCQLSTGKCMCQSVTSGLAEDCPTFQSTLWTECNGTLPVGNGSSGEVKATFTVANVDYAKLAQNTTLLNAFKKSITKVIANFS